MSQRKLLYLQIVFLAISGISSAAENRFFSKGQDGSTTVRDSSGVVLWQIPVRDSGPFAESLTPPAAPAAQPSWDQAVKLNDYTSKKGPIFDSLGNAWVFATDASNNILAFQSNGSTGTWKPPQVIGTTTAGDSIIGSMGLAVGPSGQLYVTYNSSPIEADPHMLMLIKYSPGTGWQAPVVALNSPVNFTETFPAVDAAGHLVVAFNPNAAGVSGLVCNAATSVCGPVQTLAPSTPIAMIPNMVANKSGTRLVLAYVVVGAGIVYRLFDSAASTWTPPALIPGSENATFGVYGTLSEIPMAVDSAGNISIVSTVTGRLRTFSIAGYHFEGGQWTAKQLLPPTRSLTDIASFGSITVNDTGLVLAAVGTSLGGSGVPLQMSAFRYTPGRGWSTDIAASFDGDAIMRCSAAWFQGNQAVIVYALTNISIEEEQSALFNGRTWSGGPPPIPGESSAFPKLATAPTQDVLLVMGSASKGVATGLKATWLRP